MNLKSKDPIFQLMFNLNRIHDSVRFADQKASVFILANTGLLAYAHPLLKRDLSPLNLLTALCVLGLIVSTALAFGVIVPRGDRIATAHGLGLLDAKRIFQQGTEERYLMEIERAEMEIFIKELQSMHFDFARVDVVKYRFLRWAIYSSAITWSLAVGIIGLGKFLAMP